MTSFDLRPLSPDAVGKALEKAERYRLLNEPGEAESICLDILDVDPENTAALITLLLALTDQFGARLGSATREARDLLARFESEYHRAYYEGIIWERRAKALQTRGGAGSGYRAYAGLRRALECYDRAIRLRPEGGDEAVLRWNTCVRILDRHPELRPAPEEPAQSFLE